MKIRIVGQTSKNPQLREWHTKNLKSCPASYDERGGRTVSEHEEHATELHEHLFGMTGEQSVGAAAPPGVCKHAGEDRARGPAHAMRGDDIERVVQFRARAVEEGEVAADGTDAAERERRGRDEPVAGVITTSPTTMAVADDRRHVPVRARSINVQTTSAAAGANIVFTNARTAD